MSNVERTTSWQMIQQGVKEAERLIARKEYNMVMIKARQTLEIMVRCMAERACVVEGDLSDTIDQLYEGQWIDKSTKDHYHTIRILGNKAVHEGDNTAYSANQAYQLLTQEVYVFANEFSGSKPRGGSQGSRSAQGAGRSGARPGTSQRAGQGQRGSQGPGRQAVRTSGSGSNRSGGGRRKKRRQPDPAYYIFRLLIPILAVILLIVVIRVLMPGKDKDPKQTTEAITTETPADIPEAPTEPATEAPTEPAAETYRITGNSVNVRTEPSTDSRILAQLSSGTEVDYVKRFNNDWAVINYEGQEAYVSSRYLEKVEPAAAPEDTEQGDGGEAAE